jgi:hypothetical protein
MSVVANTSGSGTGTLGRLPDTGQVQDYTATPGEDADYLINPPAYRDNGDGTVTDLVTGLIWQQQDGGELTYASAASYCQGLALAVQRDWRLPSSQELFTIVDHDRLPALDPSIFTYTNAEYWWTANELAGDSTRAWVVNAGGGTGAHPKTETISAGGSKRFHVRCVRGAPPADPDRLADNGDGTVSAPSTGLIWQQAEYGPAVKWEDALRYCESLSLGNSANWRLPNVKELRSLSDDTLVRPSLDTGLFPAARAGRYWSSTTQSGRDRSAWFVDFTSGLASYNDKDGLLYLRCVSGNPDLPTRVQ